CHNSNELKGTKGREFTIWAMHDPHAKAFEVLYGKRALQIEKNLKRLVDVTQARPECNKLCLNCHVLPGVEPLSEAGRTVPRRHTFTYEDGVSCEACHGPAEKWLTKHYQKSWGRLSAREKNVLGMSDTKDLLARASLCVTCHIGTGDLEVNHDLIAAGHPRL